MNQKTPNSLNWPGCSGLARCLVGAPRERRWQAELGSSLDAHDGVTGHPDRFGGPQSLVQGTLLGLSGLCRNTGFGRSL